MRSAALHLVTLTLLASVSGASHAAPYRHDPGLYARFALGAGFSGASFDDAQETTFSGGGGLLSIALGGTVAPNFAIYGDLFGLSMIEPTVSQGGVEQGTAERTRATVGGLGVGAAYYIMPLNLYFAGAIGSGAASVQTRIPVGTAELVIDEDSRPGLLVNLMIGKEWWVSPRWGLGLAGQAIFSRLKTDAGTEFGILGFGVVFSATMN
jgi:hypothetical protein